MPGFHLFIFILESIGTQELVLIGLVALIIFGPRKLPQMARKLGGMMSELRKVSNEFRETWEREASLDDSRFEENQIAPAIPREVKRRELAAEASQNTDTDPEIREMSKDEFEKFSMPEPEDSAATLDPDPPDKKDEEDAPPADDKRNWL